MQFKLFRILPGALALALALSLGAVSFTLTSTPAQASEHKSEKPKKPKKEKKAKKEKPTTATFYEGSSETKTQRERRLLRECKGKPNAGACEGYTR